MRTYKENPKMNNTIPTLLTNARIKELLRGVARQLYKNKEHYTYFNLTRGESEETLSAPDDFAADLIERFQFELARAHLENESEVELGYIRALVGAGNGETTSEAVKRTMRTLKRIIENLELQIATQQAIAGRRIG